MNVFDWTILFLTLLTGHKVDLRPLTQGAVGFSLDGLPLFFLHRRHGLLQIRAHDRADGKTNGASGFRGSIRMLEPFNEIVLVAGAVAAKKPFLDRTGKRCKRSSSTNQRLLLGRNVAVPELVGDDQIGW